MENVLRVKSRVEFRSWLEENAATSRECWVEVKRGKPDGAGGLFYLDAVEEALCFGWIDSTQKPVGKVRLQRFSPRKKDGLWTEQNKERARRLERLGLLTDAGRAVLPDLKPRSFKPDPAVVLDLKAARVWAAFCRFPALYRRIRLYNLGYCRARLPGQYPKALAHLVAETKRGRTYGNWDDYGRLTEDECK